MDDAPTITLLEALKTELRSYIRDRARASDKLADQPEYLAKVLAGWDHAIGVKRAQIEREEQRCSSV